MYAWGRSGINEQKHPEIAWAADTHYLSHLAATLDNQPVLNSPWQMLRGVNGCTANRGGARVCACGSLQKSMQRNADHGISLPGKLFGKSWCCSKPENNSTILQHLPPKQHDKSSKQQLCLKSLSIACCCCVFSAEWVPTWVPQPLLNLHCPGKLHLLPEIWGAVSTDTHWDILFLPAAGSKHAPQPTPTPQIALLLLLLEPHTLSVFTNSLTLHLSIGKLAYSHTPASHSDKRTLKADGRGGRW